MAQLQRVASDVPEDASSLGESRWSSEESEAQHTSYKQRSEELRRLFRELPESERLLVDYACALQRDILLQGRLYLTENWLCFHSNVFRGTTIAVSWEDITTMSREKTARLIPNAIQICTEGEKLFFSSFTSREKSYQGIFRLWQNMLMDKPLTRTELWQMVKQHYGNDLGLNHEEMENLQISADNASQASGAVRAGGEEHAGRMERPSSLRLPGDSPPLDGTTQVEEPQPSPAPQSGNSGTTEELRVTPSRQRSPDPLDRQAPERSSKRSSLSLDLNANEDQLSEHSGSESVEEEERPCPLQAQGRLYVNRVFHISAEKMFDLLFSDSHFIRRFMDIRKITGMTSTPWQRDGSGCMKRTLNYTITITNPLVGKFSTATETQTLYRDAGERQYYMVDSEVYTHDVPYHDYFYTFNRFCIIPNSKHKCRLRVYTDVKYKKQPWGLVKSFITKNSWSGLEDYFRHLEVELLEEEAELTQGGGDHSKIGGLRRRRRTYSRSVSEHLKQGKQYPAGDPERHRDSLAGAVELKGTRGWSISTIVAGMSLILLILTVLNLGLFVKLWAMEDVAQRMYLSTKQRLRDKVEPSLNPDLGSRSREENHLLRTVLQDSIHLLEQLRSSLQALQRSFEVRNATRPRH
ncbi:protein Aster-C [Megalops cyprinoides]|uniref:protein Aster-C n=1 Tax=Megalops cyprinoides TaxID=118141 RepID=UPI0018656304|nr:protein Aster-C [Megalops cyprinoides]